MKNVTRINTVQANQYYDALNDLVDILQLRDFSFKNTLEREKFYESIELLKEYKKHELKFL